MWRTVLLVTAGLLMTSSSNHLMILRLMISDALVCLPFLSSPFPPLQSANKKADPLVPKFQGENFYANLSIVKEIKRLATARGCTITQIALAWVAAQGMIAIPGTTKPHRLEENFASREIELTDAEKKEMRKLIDGAKIAGVRYSEAHEKMVGH